MLTESAAKTSQIPGKNAVFVDVALPVPLRQTFTYIHQKNQAGPAKIGSRVIVPFGKQRLTGYIVGIHDRLDKEMGLDETRIRSVLETVDNEPLLTDEILELTKWAAGYYSSSWGEMLKASLPAGINALIETVFQLVDPPVKGTKLNQIQASIMESFVPGPALTIKEIAPGLDEKEKRKALNLLVRKGLLSRSHRIGDEQIRPLVRKAARLLDETASGSNAAQNSVIEYLKGKPEGATLTEIKSSTGIGVSAVKTLSKHGVVTLFDKEVDRDPLAGTVFEEPVRHDLTNDQKIALEKILGAVGSKEYKTFLLKGVTGSGKTEVYINAMEKALELGRTALMMVPEIALTPVFSKQLRSVFGKQVAILHSSLSSGERYDEWRRIRSGDARVVIGTRSAIFAPLENIGLIVVDEEHDSSYRQHEMPFYHGRDTAIVRASKAGAVVVLGSATPALESFRNAVEGRYEQLELPTRISDRPLATAELIDMRIAFSEDGKDVVLSNQLREAIAETHEKREQSMILLNRRGFSQFVLCRACGESIKCRNCEITLTFHRREQELICHYCNHRVKTPETCPSCESRFLYFLGEGTEQIEDMLRTEFPEIRIARVDRDSTRKKRQLERVLEDFSNHKTDMLVGTQMIAKGHDFPNVTLVGVISVDAGLSIPEFRSAERTFQLLTQVAGRAGRGQRPGRVLIQTYHPEHYALTHAKTQDYRAFYDHEIGFREKLHYPPFVALGLIMFKHADYRRALRNAEIMQNSLKKSDLNGRCIVLGPAPAPLARLKGEFRIQILIKSRNRRILRETIDIALADAESRNCEIKFSTVEIDPINLL
jgi:primosomal protein N' (replication factor Y)